MNVLLKRFYFGDDCTYGVLLIDGIAIAYTLEDEHRETKVPGETCIPAGVYTIEFRETLSRLTKKYRNRYDWFTWHLWIKDIPDFDYVYIHAGNTDEDTMGCPLVGYTSDLRKKDKNGFIGNSRDAYKEVYQAISLALSNNDPVIIHVR